MSEVKTTIITKMGSDVVDPTSSVPEPLSLEDLSPLKERVLESAAVVIGDGFKQSITLPDDQSSLRKDHLAVIRSNMHLLHLQTILSDLFTSILNFVHAERLEVTTNGSLAIFKKDRKVPCRYIKRSDVRTVVHPVVEKVFDYFMSEITDEELFKMSEFKASVRDLGFASYACFKAYDGKMDNAVAFGLKAGGISNLRDIVYCCRYEIQSSQSVNLALAPIKDSSGETILLRVGGFILPSTYYLPRKLGMRSTIVTTVSKFDTDDSSDDGLGTLLSKVRKASKNKSSKSSTMQAEGANGKKTSSPKGTLLKKKSVQLVSEDQRPSPSENTAVKKVAKPPMPSVAIAHVPVQAPTPVVASLSDHGAPTSDSDVSIPEEDLGF